MNIQTRLRWSAAAILFLGLGAAIFVYQDAVNDSDIPSGRDIQNSKRYVRNLRVYGGEMAVLEDELCRWFGGLWQGTSLAGTLVCLTVLTSGGILLTDHYLKR